jgi:hypothetical protein
VIGTAGLSFLRGTEPVMATDITHGSFVGDWVTLRSLKAPSLRQQCRIANGAQI